MYITNNMSKCLIIFGIKDETTINNLLSDLKIDMNNANISNIVLNNKTACVARWIRRHTHNQ